jgi:dTDP-4-amino-4,6-dideoxygalactose transaminase
VSRRILNLPVHQDVEPAELERLVAALGDLVGRA